VLLSHNSLANYYSLVFSLAQHHKYSITEIENLMPFERDIYVAMLIDHLEKEKIKNEERAAQQKRR
jgi:hypothetical protein|tara:strand:- start:2130 stop:2327 length:198 start_codon:yes stop_codon:yes gene_type:complete